MNRATEIFGLGSHHRVYLTSMGRLGFRILQPSDQAGRQLLDMGLLVEAGRTQRDDLPYVSLSDTAAHMVFHAMDAERGVHASMYGDWRTKWEARVAGDLKPTQETLVLVCRNSVVGEWVHPDDCEVSQ